MQCGIERAFPDRKGGAGCLFDPVDDGITVPRPPTQGFEDEEVERAAGEIDVEVVHMRSWGMCAKMLASFPSARKGRVNSCCMLHAACSRRLPTAWLATAYCLLLTSCCLLLAACCLLLERSGILLSTNPSQSHCSGSRFRLPTPDSRLPTLDSRFPIPDSRLPIPGSVILETRHLQLIAAVAEHGTLTRSCRDLNLTQSALSHQLATLEAKLGTPLFIRTGKRMAMTEAGERLLAAAQRTLGELRAVETELQQAADGQAAVLRVSTECYTTYHWLPRVIRAFAERCPQVEVQIVIDATSDPIAALHAGTIDVAIMMNRHTGKHVRSFPLFDDELVLAVSSDHDFASRSSVEVADLASAHLLVHSQITDSSSFIGGLLRTHRVTPRRVSRIQLTEAILELVEAGMGVSVLARSAIAPYAARCGVVMVPITRAGLRRRWHAVALKQTATSVHVRDFAALLTAGPPLAEEPQPAPPRSTVGRRRPAATRIKRSR
jgi:LysR family transcriptional regulator for metE and metH